MPIYVNGGEAGKLYMMSDPPLQIGKVYADGALIYSGEETIVLSKTSADGTAYSAVWFNTPVSGFASVTLTIEVPNALDIFWAGISTQRADGSVADASPAGALYNIKSVNGDKAGTYVETLQLDAAATYYVYVGVYTGNTANKGSIKITAAFS
jgi:hypothetical protein